MGFSPSQLQKKLEEKKLLKDSAIFTEGVTDPTAALAEESTSEEVAATSEMVVVPATSEPHVTETQVKQDVTQASALASVVKETELAPPAPQVTTEPVVTEPVVELEKKQEEQQQETPSLESIPTLGDTSVFKKVSTTASESAPILDSYAEMVENMVASQCQLSGVKNLDLTTFGVRAQVIKFPNLSVLEYGKHKFLGAPFTEEEENSIIHKIALYVATSNKQTIVIRAVQEVRDANGLVFHSLLFTDAIAQKFVNMFNYTIYTNPNEADVSKLVLVVQK